MFREKSYWLGHLLEGGGRENPVTNFVGSDRINEKGFATLILHTYRGYMNKLALIPVHVSHCFFLYSMSWIWLCWRTSVTWRQERRLCFTKGRLSPHQSFCNLTAYPYYPTELVMFFFVSKKSYSRCVYEIFFLFYRSFWKDNFQIWIRSVKYIWVRETRINFFNLLVWESLS